MGHLSRIFEQLPIEVQKRNGFDLSHVNCGTAKCGQLTPVLKRLLMPNTKFSLGCSMNVELPPLATSFFGRIDAVVEVFFCPCSILYGGFRQFIINQLASMFPDSQDDVENAGGYVLPWLVYDSANANAVFSGINSLASTNDGLADYLGMSAETPSGLTWAGKINILPFLAYHKICDVFYRNPQVTKTWFAVNPNIGKAEYNAPADSGGQSWGVASALNNKNVSFIWHSYYSEVQLHDPSLANSLLSSSGAFSSTGEITFPDGISVLKMRQRPWARDYFTAGLNSPQQGSAPEMKLAVSNNEATLSISMIRASNSLQKFVEHNGLSMDYSEGMFVHFGVRPSDALLDEPMYLGRLVVPVYQKSVYQHDAKQNVDDANSSNPFVKNGMLGAKGAHGSFVGEGSIVESFHVKCFGYLMGLFSLVPHTMYNYGLDKDLTRLELGDYPFPELQSVGMDDIKTSEIYFDGTPNTSTFCYTQRYAYEKYINDQAHGELRPGKSLESFVLQRSFAAAPQFGTQFSLIPQDALDGVLGVSTETMNMSCWYEIFWVFKASMPLAEYSIPTLGDLKDTYTVRTHQGGPRL